MAMQHTSLARKVVPAHRDHDECDADDWPMPTKRDIIVGELRDQAMVMGWRLKNIGLKKLGLWMVRTFHRGPTGTFS